MDHWFRVSERVWDSAHVHLHQAVRSHKDFPDACRSHTPVYCPGDQVWLSNRDLRLHLPCQKLSPRFIGPFTIERQINSPCIPRLTSQALLSICPRHRRTGSTTSSRSSRGTRHLPSMRNLGFPSTHPEAMAGPIAVVGRQEPPLEEGVLSGSHSHLSHHQLHTPDPTHLITDHRHQTSSVLYQRTLPNSHCLVSNIPC